MRKNNINLYIGQRLRQRRISIGLSQKKVGDMIGVTFQQVQKYEKGTDSLSIHRLYDFAHSLQIPIASLFEELKRAPMASEKEPPKNKELGRAIPAATNRELLEMLKIFRQIKNPIIRKRLADIARCFADEIDTLPGGGR